MSICNIGDNIITPLGFTTEDNLLAIKNQKSGIRHYEKYAEIPEPFSASIIDIEKLNDECSKYNLSLTDYTRFERLAILSILKASETVKNILESDKTLFILSSTKGNVELLDKNINIYHFNEDRLYLWKSAEIIARYFNNPNTPIVVSNACISGVAAQIVAKRMIESGRYDSAVVTGVDVLSKFVVSGFQSFKALSEKRCKPFDSSRDGLNIGEGVGTIIYQKEDETLNNNSITLMSGAITNDANHISGPSRTGEGLYRAILETIGEKADDKLQFVNVHGTATLYNDEMEAKALSRANLLKYPVFSLKAYFGHTLGASGIIETIISAHALKEGFIPLSLGFENLGVSQPVQIVNKSTSCEKRGNFIKTVSGFGGCNAVISLKVI
jgi:3-oxoacyl-[acyl-carrier-protein] synthase-1